MKILMIVLIAMGASLAHADVKWGGYSFDSSPREEFTTLPTPVPTPMPTPVPTPIPPHTSRLFVQNTCYTDIWVAIQTVNPRGQWESQGFFHIYPGQIQYLTNFQNNYYYLHGLTSDRRVYWQGPHTIVLGGRVLPALMINNVYPRPGGDWTTVLFCY